MVRIVKFKEKQKKKCGRPSKLIIEDQILLTFQYLREYRTYYHIGKDWKISESNTYRIVLKIENILIKSKKFSLPGKKKLLNLSLDEDLILMDVMESPIERPKKHQKRFYSGKQGEHTLKTQVVFGTKTNQIICLDHSKGKTHDFKLFKKSDVKFHKLLKVIADKGYQGITKLHNLSQTPIKKPRGGRLTKSQKKYNRELNRLRIAVEHVNRRLKIFKILSYPYRNRHRRFGLRTNLIAGIYNYELAA
ncbi:MAG: IS5 family transposase [Richelia sp. SM1_7_0]|nr:IS5 family transposase [Richelia sp. SM1_7_0]